MGFSKTPYEMQREQQERAIRAQEEQQARQIAAQAWNSFANMDVGGEAIKPLNLPIDWQHGADIGAKRAAGIELQNLEGEQKLAQIAAKAAEDRTSTGYELALKAKYAPKKTGGGGPDPINKTINKMFGITDVQHEDPTAGARAQGQLLFLFNSLGNKGSRGREAQQQWIETMGHPSTIDLSKITKYSIGQEKLSAEAEQKRAEQLAREAAEQRGYGFQATRTLAQPPKGDTFGENEEDKKARAEAQKRLMGYTKQTSTQRAEGTASKSSGAPEGFVYLPKNGIWMNAKGETWKP